MRKNDAQLFFEHCQQVCMLNQENITRVLLKPIIVKQIMS